jgi:hypothetical protein
MVGYGIILGFGYREHTTRELLDLLAESAVVTGILVFMWGGFIYNPRVFEANFSREWKRGRGHATATRF